MWYSVRGVATDPMTLALLALCVVATGPLALAAAGRLSRPWWVCALALASVGGILAATLTPASTTRGFWDTRSRASETCVISLLDARSSLASLSTDSHDAAANVLLFVPAGVLLAICLRRAVLVVVGLMALSAAIEMVQSQIGRACAGADLMANTFGALIGAAAGVLLVRLALAIRSVARSTTA